MAKQAANIRHFSPDQIPHPEANLQKANDQPWEQVQLKMPDKRPGGWAPMELIETLGLCHISSIECISVVYATLVYDLLACDSLN
jgi:hypothetical protein